jgi:hypothetical protein
MVEVCPASAESAEAEANWLVVIVPFSTLFPVLDRSPFLDVAPLEVKADGPVTVVCWVTATPLGFSAVVRVEVRLVGFSAPVSVTARSPALLVTATPENPFPPKLIVTADAVDTQNIPIKSTTRVITNSLPCFDLILTSSLETWRHKRQSAYLV